MTTWFGSKTITVPADVTALVSRDTGAEVAPRTAGMTRTAVDAIWRAVERWYGSGTQPFISLVLRRHGQVVLKRSIGHSHGHGPGMQGEQPQLGAPDTPVALFSASKAVTAILIHQLAERRELDLHAPVRKYLPEFGQAGKRRVTLEQILAHRAGVPQMPPEYRPEHVFDFDATLKMLCAAPAAAGLASRTAYHAVSGGFILGAVAQRVTGCTLQQLGHTVLEKPLGLTALNYGIDAARVGTVAENFSTGPALPFPIGGIAERALGATWDEVVQLSNDPRFFEAVIPSGNVIATADDVSRFMQMLLNGGELDGIRILSPQTVERATRVVGGTGFDRMMFVPMRYSPGLMLGNSPFGLFGPGSRNAFGHLGFINIFCWADPDRDIAVALLSTGKSLLGTHLFALLRLLTTIGMQTFRDVARAS